MLENFLKSQGKALEDFLSENSLQEIPGKIRKALSFQYDDTPMDEKYVDFHIRWVKLLHDYYFKCEHTGHLDEVHKVARHEKAILISNHANTLEAPLLCYYFYTHHLGIVHPMVYKGAFGLPLIREFIRSGQSLPISVETGKEALKKDHILIFPEGMDFIKHYLKKDFVVKFHRGFLRIAQEFLEETGKKEIPIIPVAHDGIDYTIKFWVIKNSFLVEHLIKPYLKFPYFAVPKAPVVFPTKATFNWGRPRMVTLEELRGEKAITRLSNEFRHEILRLRSHARRINQMERSPNGKSDERRDFS